VRPTPEGPAPPLSLTARAAYHPAHLRPHEPGPTAAAAQSAPDALGGIDIKETVLSKPRPAGRRRRFEETGEQPSPAPASGADQVTKPIATQPPAAGQLPTSRPSSIGQSPFTQYERTGWPTADRVPAGRYLTGTAPAAPLPTRPKPTNPPTIQSRPTSPPGTEPPRARPRATERWAPASPPQASPQTGPPPASPPRPDPAAPATDRPTGRRARRRGLGARPTLPSVTEITFYTLFGAAVASGVFVVGGRPIWHVGFALAAAVVIILLLAIVSSRGGRPTLLPPAPDPPLPTDTQHDPRHSDEPERYPPSDGR
jgi:hypothetical protein